MNRLRQSRERGFIWLGEIAPAIPDAASFLEICRAMAGKFPPKSLRTEALSLSASPFPKCLPLPFKSFTRSAFPRPAAWSSPADSISSSSPISKNSSPAGKSPGWSRKPPSTTNAVRAHLEKSGSGAMFSADDAAPPPPASQLKPYLADGGVLIFVPGRATTRNATASHIPAAHLQRPVRLRTAGPARRRRLPARVLPVHRAPVVAAARRSSSVGKPIAAADASIATYPASAAGSQRGSLQLAPAFQGLARHDPAGRTEETWLATTGSSTAPTTPNCASTTSSPPRIVFSKFIQEETDKPRVAIVLPPGKAGLIANLAVLFAGKVPVNLNFTAGHEADQILHPPGGRRPLHHRRSLCSQSLLLPLAAEPRPDLHRARPAHAQEEDRHLGHHLARLLPAAVLGLLLGTQQAPRRRRGRPALHLRLLRRTQGRRRSATATCWPTSASSAPASICQPARRILGCLPLFHSFGCTVTLWFPVIEGINLVTYPSPLETKRLAELIALHQINVFLSTPTFLRGYMKRIDPGAASPRSSWSSPARKNFPQSLANAFEEKFGIRPAGRLRPDRNLPRHQRQPARSRTRSAIRDHAPLAPATARSARCCPASPSASPIPPPTRTSRSTSRASSGSRAPTSSPATSATRRNPPKSSPGRLVPHRRCRPRR